MKIYLGPGVVPANHGDAISLGRLEELEECPTCHSSSSRDVVNARAYQEGREFGVWIRKYVTGRFYDGLLDDLNGTGGVE